MDERVSYLVPSSPELFQPLNETLALQVMHVDRNLLSAYQEEVKPSMERVKVYLRLRPSGSVTEGLFKTVSERNISVTNPSRGTISEFSFSYVFPCDSCQEEVYRQTTEEMVFEVCKPTIARDGLLFCYGVTSSGKTYTIQGSKTQPGMIPMALMSLFGTIGDRLESEMRFRPKYCNEYAQLEAEEATRILALKEALLRYSEAEDAEVTYSCISSSSNLTSSSSSSSLSSWTSSENSEPDSLIVPLANGAGATLDNVTFSVWVSFCEIYNEIVYDLLQPLTKNNAQRNTLKIGEDKKASVYLKGITQIPVNSADEALKLLLAGIKNLRFAATKLNYNSSRRLTFFDLAGSERSSKTGTTGDRLRETGNINTSLLTLGRCLRNILHNQQNSDNPVIVPFRDSKLTRLMQSFFVCDSTVSMIVNVSSAEETFDETCRVLEFASIAREVKIQQNPISFRASAVPPAAVVQKPPLLKAGLKSDDVEDDDVATPQAPSSIEKTITKNTVIHKGFRCDKEQEATDRRQLEQEIRQEISAEFERYKKQLIESYDAGKARFEVEIRQQVYQDFEQMRKQIEARHIRERQNMMLDTQVYSDLREEAFLKANDADTTVNNDDLCLIMDSTVSNATECRSLEANHSPSELEDELSNLRKELEAAVQRNQELEARLQSCSTPEPPRRCQKCEQSDEEKGRLDKELRQRDEKVKALQQASCDTCKSLKEKNQQLEKDVAERDRKVDYLLAQERDIKNQLYNATASLTTSQSIAAKNKQLNEDLRKRDLEFRALVDEVDALKTQLEAVSQRECENCHKYLKKNEELANENQRYRDMISQQNQEMSQLKHRLKSDDTKLLPSVSEEQPLPYSLRSRRKQPCRRPSSELLLRAVMSDTVTPSKGKKRRIYNGAPIDFSPMVFVPSDQSRIVSENFWMPGDEGNQENEDIKVTVDRSYVQNSGPPLDEGGNAMYPERIASDISKDSQTEEECRARERDIVEIVTRKVQRETERAPKGKRRRHAS